MAIAHGSANPKVYHVAFADPTAYEHWMEVRPPQPPIYCRSVWPAPALGPPSLHVPKAAQPPITLVTRLPMQWIT